ncbi:hypothetical protein HK102_005002 [Quaeritorhiza haematococci]|nr:hypothetical protein HK102_005002 [Quaeritorhiza haematococci]
MAPALQQTLQSPQLQPQPQQLVADQQCQSQPNPSEDADDYFKRAYTLMNTPSISPLLVTAVFSGLLLIGTATKAGVDWVKDFERKKEAEKQQLIIGVYQKHLSDFTDTSKAFLQATINDRLYTELESVGEWQAKLNPQSQVTPFSSQICNVALPTQFKKGTFTFAIFHLVCMHAIEISYLSCSDKSVAKVKAIAKFCHDMANQFTSAKKNGLEESWWTPGCIPRLKENSLLQAAQLFEKAAETLRTEQNDFRRRRNDFASGLLNLIDLLCAKVYNIGLPDERVNPTCMGIFEEITSPPRDKSALQMIVKVVEVLKEKEGTKMTQAGWNDLLKYFRDSPLDVDRKFVLGRDLVDAYTVGIRAAGVLALWRVKVLKWDLAHATDEEVKAVCQESVDHIKVLTTSQKQLQCAAHDLRIKVNKRQARAPGGWLKRQMQTIPEREEDLVQVFETQVQKILEVVPKQPTTEGIETQPMIGRPRERERASLNELHQKLNGKEIGALTKAALASVMVDGLRKLGFHISDEEHRRIVVKLTTTESRSSGTRGRKTGGLNAALLSTLVVLPHSQPAFTELTDALPLVDKGSEIENWTLQHKQIMFEQNPNSSNSISPEERRLGVLYWEELGLLGVQACLDRSNPIHQLVEPK